MPDSPVKAKLLTEHEKVIHVERLREDQIGIENKTFKKQKMIEAFLSPKTWLIVLFQLFISIPNGGLTNVRSSRTYLTASLLYIVRPLIIKGPRYTS
jgi:ACS family allantoate permease-like MFS transporter